LVISPKELWDKKFKQKKEIEMGIYKLRVEETVLSLVEYLVEADSAEEAREKGASGDTIEEKPVKQVAVTNRYVNKVELVDENEGAAA
jgi:hypothetical protein